MPTPHRQPTDEQSERSPAPSVDPAQILANPYEVLSLSQQASAEDIKKAYFAKVREFPPEREPTLFKAIRSAYDALRTPEARAATDLFLLHPPTPYEPYKRAPAFDLSFHPEDW